MSPPTEEQNQLSSWCKLPLATQQIHVPPSTETKRSRKAGLHRSILLGCNSLRLLSLVTHPEFLEIRFDCFDAETTNTPCHQGREGTNIKNAATSYIKPMQSSLEIKYNKLSKNIWYRQYRIYKSHHIIWKFSGSDEDRKIPCHLSYLL